MIWRLASTGAILLTFSGFLSLPLVGDGVGVTAMWWFAGMPVVHLMINWRLQRFRTPIIWTICMLFAVDLGIQIVLRGFFGAMPQPYAIAEAIANTNAAETLNFIQSQAHSLGRAVTGLVVFAVIAWLELRWHGKPLPLTWGNGLQILRKIPRQWWTVAKAMVVAFFVLLHFNPTMLRGHPVLRLPVFYERFVDAREAISMVASERAAHGASLTALLKQMPTESAHSHLNGQTIKILVIGESSNRDNWSLYGYARDTTAPLDQLVAESPARFDVIRQAYSTHAFTAESLRDAFILRSSQGSTDGLIGGPDVFQVAQSFGYEVNWLSNQPKGDGWIAALADGADRAVFINNGNWRDSSSLDRALLPHISEALHATAMKPMLIVIHVLGQHFHYDQRCPANGQRFANASDRVTAAMVSQGRKSWVIEQRNAYDSAVYCGAELLADIVKAADQASQKFNKRIELLYFSDHGQEVGHNDNVASHSTIFRSGYKIPLFKWRSTSTEDAIGLSGNREFQMRQMPSTILGFLEIKAQQLYREENDVFSPAFESLSPTVADAKRLKGD